MSGSGPGAGRAAALRREFDRAFAEAPPGTEPEATSLLCITVGGEPWAIPLGDVGGLFVDQVVVGLPGPVPELLGLAGLQGGVVPVYSLRGLLGLGPGARERWLVTAGRGTGALALAFEALDSYQRVPTSDVLAVEGARGGPHVAGAARIGGLVRRVVDVGSLVAAVRGRVGA